MKVTNKGKPVPAVKTKAKAKAKAKAIAKTTPAKAATAAKSKTKIPVAVRRDAVQYVKLAGAVSRNKARGAKDAADFKRVGGQLSDYADEAMADELTIELGTVALRIGPHGQQTSIANVERAYQLLEQIDPALPMQLMKFDIGALRDYLTPEQLEEVLLETQTGARKITAKPVG